MIVHYHLGLGANLAPSLENIKRAIEFIKQRLLLNKFEKESLVVSSFYKSLAHNAPADSHIKNQITKKHFINCVVSFRSSFNPFTLFDIIRKIESEIDPNKINNQSKKIKLWQDRLIDIDLLLAGDQIINTDLLKVPHYDLTNRAFVLKPLLEISPHLIHPKSNQALLKYSTSLPIKDWQTTQKISLSHTTS